jgi:hypothetical protein
VRNITPVESISMDWQVDVQAIQQAAKDSASLKKTTFVRSTSYRLLGGVKKWCMQLQCKWDGTASKAAQSGCLHVLILFQLAHSVAALSVWSVSVQLQYAPTKIQATFVQLPD